MATGKIARAFVEELRLLPEAEVVAVGARSLDSATAFSQNYGVPRAHGSYQELVDDPAVDVVYIATPHALHRDHVLMAFEAGKPVLCEKSLTLNAAQAEELVAESHRRRLFLMEAMWMRCNPLVRRLQQLVGTGELGTVQQVRADLGFVVDKPPSDRLLDPALGGGALLDMGIYPLTFAHLFLGEPTTVAATAGLAPTGIDLNVAVSLGYDGGAVASVTSSMTSWSPRTASVATERGRIDVPAPFHHPARAIWTGEGGEAVEITEPVLGTGLANEAREVVRCLRNGEIESPLVPHEVSLSTMRLMDRIRAQVGVEYAADALLTDRS